MDIRNTFNSYMKSDDVTGAGEEFTVEDVSIKTFSGKEGPEVKLIVKFKECPRALACNATNRKKLVKIFGPETDEWVGKKVMLHLESVDYMGESFDAIRVVG